MHTDRPGSRPSHQGVDRSSRDRVRNLGSGGARTSISIRLLEKTKEEDLTERLEHGKIIIHSDGLSILDNSAEPNLTRRLRWPPDEETVNPRR